MNVTWFTNIELPELREYLKATELFGGFWMESLRKELISEEKVNLSIAAEGGIHFGAKELNKTKYYNIPVKKKSTRFQKFIGKIRKQSLDSLLNKCLSIVEESKPDIIHVHGCENPYGILSAMTDIPVVVSLQGILQAYMRHAFCGMEIRDYLMDVISVKHCKGSSITRIDKLRRKLERTERRVLQQAKYIIGRTDWDHAAARVLAPEAKYYHCDEILRDEFYCASTWNQEHSNAPILFGTFNASPRKGLIPSIDAFSNVVEKYPTAQLRIAGSIKGSALWQIIKRRMRKHGVEERIFFLGSLNAREIVREIQNCSVFIHPSFVDNSPNSLAEAMMLGCPIVAAHTGGVPSMLEHGVEGFLFPPGDSYSLAWRIIEVFKIPAEARRMAAAARAQALLRHDKEKIRTRMMQIYSEVIEEEKKG